jgi:hypothetical protein
MRQYGENSLGTSNESAGAITLLPDGQMQTNEHLRG